MASPELGAMLRRQKQSSFAQKYRSYVAPGEVEACGGFLQVAAGCRSRIDRKAGALKEIFVCAGILRGKEHRMLQALCPVLRLWSDWARPPGPGTGLRPRFPLLGGVVCVLCS